MALNSIGFIPDGNRRYAEFSGISPLAAYMRGTQKAWDVLDWIVKYPQIKAGTFYTLSLENLSRSRAELAILFRIFDRELERIKEKTIFAEHGIKLNFLGKRELFPRKLREKMRAAETLTAGHKERTINLALGYGGRAEIVDAAKKLAEEHKRGALDLNSVDENTFRNYLYADFQDPDMIVRTSGTKRLSGFLTYQSAYSELYFLDKYWPELQESDLATAIGEYEARERRFGH